jgi:hypothetical protein
MINISAAMAGEFAFAAAEISAEIKRYGPNPLRSNDARPTRKTPSPVAEESAQVTDASPD